MFETTYCNMDTTLDSYNDGADLDTMQCILNERIHFSANTIAELVKEVCEHYCYSCPEPQHWLADHESGYISTCFIVDKHNNEITTKDGMYKQFVAGKEKLWILDLLIGVRYIETRTPTAEEFEPFGQ
jgi:hypothetical protein